jgi:hypothetical protein
VRKITIKRRDKMRVIEKKEFETIYEEVKKIKIGVEGEIGDLSSSKEVFDIKRKPNSIEIRRKDYEVEEGEVYIKGDKLITFNLPGKRGKLKGSPSTLHKLLESIEVETLDKKFPTISNLWKELKIEKKIIGGKIYYKLGKLENPEEVAKNLLTLALLKIEYGREKFKEEFEIEETEDEMQEENEKDNSEKLKDILEYIDINTLILKDNFFSNPPKTSPERVAFLPVRPDWNEPRKMWGYYNPLTGLFYPTDGLKVLLNAFRDYVKNKDKYVKDKDKKYFAKYFILLDEMNLARVEYYMSDLLSLMENMCRVTNDKVMIGETAMIHPLSRCVLSKVPEKFDEKWEKYIKIENKEIKWKLEGEKLCMENCDECPYKALKENLKEQPAPEEENMEEFIKNFSPIPPRIAYPENLVIIGTVNVDETTFSFAPKVLDRAFVAEFNEVHVDEYLKICSDLKSEKNVFFNFVDTLIKILQPANLHFGYRVIHEMLEYLYTAHIIKKDEKKFIISDLTQMNDKSHPHFDFLLKSKVLPKIHGGEERVEEVLRNLLAYCFSDNYANGAQKLKESKKTWWRKSLNEIISILTEKEKDKSDEAIPSEDTGNPKEFRFKESASKILEMYRRLKDTGYCSYF